MEGGGEGIIEAYLMVPVGEGTGETKGEGK